MIDRPAPLRLGVPNVEAARTLADAWQSGPSPVGTSEIVSLENAEGALRSGAVDMAFVPTLAILRDPLAFSVIPGVALVGLAYASARLHLPAGLGNLTPESRLRVGLDPQMAQEAVVTQVILKEAYSAHPQFVPVPAAGEAGPAVDGYLLPANAPLSGGGVTLDLGREWFELTTRPMVWALLATSAGGVETEEARLLGEVAADVQGDDITPGVEEPASVTLAEYGYAGLELLMQQLFYHGIIEEMVEIPFVDLSDGSGEEGDELDERD